MCCAVIIVNDDTSLTIINTSIQLMMSTSRAADTLNVRTVCRLEQFSFSSQESVSMVFGSPVH